MKRPVYIFSFLLVVFLGITAFYFYQQPDKQSLNYIHKHLAESTYKKWNTYFEKIPIEKVNLVPLDSLLTELHFFEDIFIRRLFSLTPEDFDIRGFSYKHEKPTPLKQIGTKIFRREEKTISIIPQYVPMSAYEPLITMMNDATDSTGDRLYVYQGFRSSGRQAFLFLKTLIGMANYSLEKTISFVALPGYSPHNSYSRTGIAFTTQEGAHGFDPDPGITGFDYLPAIEWLKAHSQNYSFYEFSKADYGLRPNIPLWYWIGKQNIGAPMLRDY